MSCDPSALAMAGIRGLSPYQAGKPIEELQRELGIAKVIKLASNENPLGPSPRVLEACQRALPELHRYPDSNGFGLKRALADRLGVEPAMLTLGNGSNDVLDLVARAFLGPGRAAVFSQHGFIVYPIATQACGARAIVVPARAWGHDLQAMAAAVTDDTAVVFVANPNNPTGTWVSDAELRAFLAQVPPRVIVVLDEAYIEYAAVDGFPDGIELLAEFPNLIVTRTFSKAYGLA
ncbi:MAG TPA: aminotransferase class I/II-fold pyridoxal phosphate-dependent enzyme, partial [Spongiibacteraceae bacterium]|nr:aminotransferase class I/II-fold pyridoxal phosphate-dependent enzyme [Spongiibacteraceae bacterium]